MTQQPERRTVSMESSVELVRRARRGDRRALDRLFQRYVPALRRWARGRIPERARRVLDTDDLVQETLLKTLGRLHDFEVRGDGALQAYMRTALRHRIVDEVRKLGRRPAAESLGEAHAAEDTSPLEATIGREALERYEAALDRLATVDRDAIVARIELGLDYDHVARALGKPSRDAARMAVGRALVRLAREMDRE